MSTISKKQTGDYMPAMAALDTPPPLEKNRKLKGGRSMKSFSFARAKAACMKLGYDPHDVFAFLISPEGQKLVGERFVLTSLIDIIKAEEGQTVHLDGNIANTHGHESLSAVNQRLAEIEQKRADGNNEGSSET